MKNATVFLFPEEFEVDNYQLAVDLGSYYSQQIGNTEKECWGLILTATNELIAPITGGYMLAIQKQERVLPGWAVNDAVNDRVAKLEEETGQIITAGGKRDIKEEIELDLLPRCFVRKKVFYAWLGADRLLIDSKSPAVCDAITSLLRDALGSLPCINVAPRSVPGAVMALWVQDMGMRPANIELGNEITLRVGEADDGKAKFTKSELEGYPIESAVSCYPMVAELALEHKDAISFTLNEQLQLGKIKLSDTLQDQLSGDSEGDKAQEQRATWLLEVTAINAALDDLFVAFGGLEGVGA